MRWMVMAALLTGLAWGAAGCGGQRLDTGYKPRKLGASDAMRRSYYAAPFTPDANVPEIDKPEYERNHPQQ